MVVTMKKRKGETRNNACSYLGYRKTKRSEQVCSGAKGIELVITNGG